jgi:hypothetical protein
MSILAGVVVAVNLYNPSYSRGGGKWIPTSRSPWARFYLKNKVKKAEEMQL